MRHKTLLEKCEEKRKNKKNKITAPERKRVVRCKLQCIFHVCQMVVLSDGYGLLSGSKADLLLPGLDPITKQTTSIMNRCFITVSIIVPFNSLCPRVF